jgi:Domain of unknown function (DUF4403)
MIPRLFAVALALSVAACASAPLYPPRPPLQPGAPTVEPAPSKVVVHLTVTPEGLNQALDLALPPDGSGSFHLQGTRSLTWHRSPVDFQFAEGKVRASATIQLTADLPVVGKTATSFDLKLSGEPVVTSDYKARLQAGKLEITSKDMRVKVADLLASAVTSLREQLQRTVDDFAFDLAPRVLDAYARFAAPIELPLGDAKGCLALRVTGVEAGPTVLAGGIEKDVALIVAPSVTLPCSPPPLPAAPAPLANVATLTPGPFTVTVPIAASYAELAKATALAFTDGKLFFSRDFPELYLSDPEVYASQDQLVLKVRLAGPVRAAGMSTRLDGDIYFAGHPAVVDNELRIPDLQPTVDTSSFLLKLKASIDADSIRDQARQALRLDLGARLAAARAKVSGDFTFNPGCLRADVSRVEVTGIHPHAQYLRIYLAVTAQAAVYLPCPAPVQRPVASAR